MQEILAGTNKDMKAAVSPQTEQSFRNDFNFKRELPEPIRDLETISENFYWSWTLGGADLFRDLSPTLWEKVEQNPRELLQKMRGLRLWQKATDEDYVAKVKSFAERQKNYLSEPPQKRSERFRRKIRSRIFAPNTAFTILCRIIRAVSAFWRAII